MERNWDLSEVSDGKIYGINDMVKAGCNDCRGCSDCCHNMGESIVLDPLDIYRMTKGLKCAFSDLMNQGFIELGIVDGLILPHMKMQEKNAACPFLNTEERCLIHAWRPGICRIFPLGRVYENHSFGYFLQVHECRMEPKTKVKVKQWIAADNIKEQERFVADWHYYLKDYQRAAMNGELTEDELKQVSMRILNTYYLAEYDSGQEFYEQYWVRREKEH